MGRTIREHSESVVERIAQEDQRLEKYRNYLNATSKAATTQWQYISTVRTFLSYLDKNGIVLSEISADVVTTYIESFGRDNKKHGTRKAFVYSVLKSYCKYLCISKILSENPMEYLDRPKQKAADKVERVYLTPDDFEEMINNQNESTTGYLTKAILCCFLGTGIRVGALASINMKDYDREKGTMKTIEKEDKKVVYHLPNFAKHAVNTYLQKARWRLAERGETSLFVGNNGERLTERSIRRIVEEETEKIGKRTSPHKLRASFARILYQQTKNIYQVQKALNHSNVQTTEIYIGEDESIFKENASIMDELFSNQ